METKIGRRRLLEALGIAAGSCLLPSFPRSKAAAQARAPKRLVIFYSYHGTLPRFWGARAPSGASTPTETNFELASLLAPLAPYKRDLVLLDGLDMVSHRMAAPNPGNAHQQGHNHAIAAVRPQTAALAGGPSLDRVVARAFAGETRFPSLDVGAARGGEFPSHHYIAYSAANSPSPSDGDPRRVYNRIFADLTPPSDPGTPDPRKTLRRSVLDYVTGEIAQAKSVLAREDLRKLDAHATAVRDLEVRLGLLDDGTETPAASCAPLPGSALASLGTGRIDGRFREIADLQARIVQLALACDLTRVVTFNCEPPYDIAGYRPGQYGSTDMHDLIHKTSPRNGSLRENPDALEAVRLWHAATSQVFLQLIAGLATMPDVDGNRVLDNTVVLWNGELAEGGHQLRDLKWLLAGSAGGAIRTGRWIQFPRPNNNGPSHTDLYVSLANAVGVNITSFGLPGACTGPLRGL